MNAERCIVCGSFTEKAGVFYCDNCKHNVRSLKMPGINKETKPGKTQILDINGNPFKNKGVSCDNCKHEFIINEFLQTPLGDGRVDMSVKCPNCKTEFHSYYESEDTLRMSRELIELRGQRVPKKEVVKLRKLQEKHDRIVKQRKKLLEGLNKDKVIRKKEMDEKLLKTSRRFKSYGKARK